MKRQKLTAVILAGALAACGTVFVPAAENPLITSVSAASSSKLDAPDNFKAKTVTEDSVTLSWSKVKGASAYRVYMYDSETDEYEPVKTVTETSYTVKKLSAGKTYKFKVAALTGEEGDYKVHTKSSALKVKTEEEEKLPAPGNVTGTAATDSITLKWDEVSGADGYRVYMYDEDSGDYEVYKTVTGTSCKIDGLDSGTKYKFRLAAVVRKNGKAVEQEKTGSLSVSTKTNTKNNSYTNGSSVKPGDWNHPKRSDSKKTILTTSGIGYYTEKKDDDGTLYYSGKTYFAGYYCDVFINFDSSDKLDSYSLFIPMSYSEYSEVVSIFKKNFGYDYDFKKSGDYYYYIWDSYDVSLGYIDDYKEAHLFYEY